MRCPKCGAVRPERAMRVVVIDKEFYGFTIDRSEAVWCKDCARRVEQASVRSQHRVLANMGERS